MDTLDKLLDFLKNYSGEKIRLMEVCGSHTAAIEKNGIRSLLSEKIELISGPGCPVCVTPVNYIDKLIELSKSNIICTFGDMIRVPGTKKSLSDAIGEGAMIKMLYSPLEIFELAKENPKDDFIFAAVGFETTTPLYAYLVDILEKEQIQNVKLLTSLKTMPEVIDKLCDEGCDIDGFIAPGHVSVVTGSEIFENLAKKYNIPFVITGFSAEEILVSIYELIKLKNSGIVKNCYQSVVTQEGNIKAKEIVNKYFRVYNAYWRGIGTVENSGMILKDEFLKYDAGSIDIKNVEIKKKGCRCGDILKGSIHPEQCPLFKKMCTPESPVGACMVSYEGSCYQHYINCR